MTDGIITHERLLEIAGLEANGRYQGLW